MVSAVRTIVLLQATLGTIDHSVAPPLLVVREALAPCLGSMRRCTPEDPATNKATRRAVISIARDGTASYTSWKRLETQPRSPDWNPPKDATVSHRKLAAVDFEDLQRFIDSQAVRQLRFFVNSGPGVGDYEIEIDRQPGIQRVPVTSLLPAHIQFKQDPTLLRLICRAKELARAEPDWCGASTHR